MWNVRTMYAKVRAVFRFAGIIWIVLFCGAIVVSVGTPLLRGVYMTLASSSWVVVEAKVVAIDSHAKSAEIRYEYVIGGVGYSGDRFAFLSPGSLLDKNLIEGSYHVGDRIKIFADPDDPGESVVLRRPLLFEYLAPTALIVLAACAFGAYFILRQIALLRRESQENTLRKSPD